MRLYHPTIVLCGVALAACGEPSANTENAGGFSTFTMDQVADGSLRYCDDAGQCREVANPSGCVAVTITIDDPSGEVCERCDGAGGEILYRRCGATNMECVTVIGPEPDCVVCAWVDGSVLFSGCPASQPPDCEAGACGPALGMANYVCPDGRTVAGPTGRCIPLESGACGWEIVSCE